MMTYIVEEDIFFLDPIGDPGTEESCNENETVSFNSSDDEPDYDESEDNADESLNQQMIVVC
jgi:hypothetical protein